MSSNFTLFYSPEAIKRLFFVISGILLVKYCSQNEISILVSTFKAIADSIENEKKNFFKITSILDLYYILGSN